MAIETQLILQSLTLINPAFGVLSSTLSLGAITLKVLEPIALSLSDIGSSSAFALSRTLNIIWEWILYNVISPLLMILYLLLYFGSQVSLILMYYFIIKYVIIGTLKIYQSLARSKLLDRTIFRIFDTFSK